MVQVIERKGLDIVRRDWSLLAKELGDFCLTQILSGGYVITFTVSPNLAILDADSLTYLVIDT